MARGDVRGRRAKPPIAITRTTTSHSPPLLSPNNASKKEQAIATSSAPKQGTNDFTTKQGQGEEVGNLTEASKEGIGAKGVSFTVAAMLVGGLPRFPLTVASSHQSKPKDNTKRT